VNVDNIFQIMLETLGPNSFHLYKTWIEIDIP
jgi:hypothetical protein